MLILHSLLIKNVWSVLTHISKRNKILTEICFVRYRHSFNMPIKDIHARQIFDSRGNPTVEVEVKTELGKIK